MVTDSREIKCDMVVLAVGVKPAIELAKKAGIEIGSLGGIKVTPQMMTNLPDIYAAGDVTETYDSHETRIGSMPSGPVQWNRVGLLV